MPYKEGMRYVARPDNPTKRAIVWLQAALLISYVVPLAQATTFRGTDKGLVVGVLFALIAIDLLCLVLIARRYIAGLVVRVTASSILAVGWIVGETTRPSSASSVRAISFSYVWGVIANGVLVLVSVLAMYELVRNRCGRARA